MTDDQPVGDHEQLIEQLPELATGVLGGRERVAVLGHVSTCVSCSEELDQLIATADSLVELAAEVDPPVGFETRVIERLAMQPSGERGHDRRRRHSVQVAAAAAILAVVFGLGWAAHSIAHQPARLTAIAPGTYDGVREAPLTSAGKPLGMVAVYADEQGWLFMTVASATYSGPVQCKLTSADGVTTTVGSFDLTSGRGAWAAPLPASVDNVRSAEVVGADGRIVASAHFT